MLFALEDMFLLLRAPGNGAESKYYILIPCRADQSFLLVRTVSAELLVPENREFEEKTTEFDPMVQMEIEALLRRIKTEEQYDPLAYSSGVLPMLESCQKQKIEASKSNRSIVRSRTHRGKKRQ